MSQGEVFSYVYLAYSSRPVFSITFDVRIILYHAFLFIINSLFSSCRLLSNLKSITHILKSIAQCCNYKDLTSDIIDKLLTNKLLLTILDSLTVIENACAPSTHNIINQNQNKNKNKKISFYQN